jgi:Mg-chelatase subunit ChlD
MWFRKRARRVVIPEVQEKMQEAEELRKAEEAVVEAAMKVASEETKWFNSTNIEIARTSLSKAKTSLTEIQMQVASAREQVCFAPVKDVTTVDADSQTLAVERKKVDSAACQTDRKVQNVDIQTMPQVYVEMVRGSQCPLDLVCCLDSSVSVGVEEFNKSKAFVERLVKELDMPPVKVGVIRFNDNASEIAPLTSDSRYLSDCLEGMAFQPGETKFAPPLTHALGMFEESRGQGMAHRDQCLILLTDGDPGDIVEAEAAAKALKRTGVQLIFIQIGDLVKRKMIEVLASKCLIEDRHIFKLSSFDELVSAVSDVLRIVTKVSQWVKRAKCLVDLRPYQSCTNLDDVPGYDIMVPGWEHHGPDSWYWEPAHATLQDECTVPWQPICRNLMALSEDLALAKVHGDSLGAIAPSMIPDDTDGQKYQVASHTWTDRSLSTTADLKHTNDRGTCPAYLPFAKEPADDSSGGERPSASVSHAPYWRYLSPASTYKALSPADCDLNAADLIKLTVDDKHWSQEAALVSERPAIGISGAKESSVESLEHSIAGASPQDLRRIKKLLEHQHGDLRTAFHKFDDSRTQRITKTKLSKGLDSLGIARPTAESIFKRLAVLSHCEMRGDLGLEDWLIAFEFGTGEKTCIEQPLLASIDAMLAQRHAEAQSWRSQRSGRAPQSFSRFFASTATPTVPSQPPFPTMSLQYSPSLS